MPIETGTSSKHRYELIKATLLVIVGALITITIVYGIEYFTPKPESTSLSTEILPSDEATTITEQPTDQPKKYSQEELNQIFEMDKKSPETKLYYSEKLGVGFTYAPYNPTFEEGMSSEGLNLNTVKEIGNTIYLTDGSKEAYDNPSSYGNSLEIFTKDPKDILEQAVTKEFLIGANPKDCFVAVKKYESFYRGYISYVPDKTKLNDDNAYYGGAVNCPAKTIPYIGNEGAAWFFVLNEKDVNNSKYGFLSIGSGAQSANAGYKNYPEMPWSDTIRFLK
jgi:hypothetical protein